MRLIILTLCVLVAAAVFATMFLSIWSSRREAASTGRANLGTELVWAAIPCLMIVAAAIPAIMAVAASSPGDSGTLPGTARDAEWVTPERSTAMEPGSLGDPLQVRARRGDS